MDVILVWGKFILLDVYCKRVVLDQCAGAVFGITTFSKKILL